MSRSFHLTRPDWPGELGDEGEVVDALLHGPRYLQEAIEMWRLAGDAERAERIHRATLPSYAREDAAMHTAEIEELLDAMNPDALEDALKRTDLVDSDLMVPPERLPELRRRVRDVKVNKDPQLAIYDLQIASSHVYELARFFRRALDEGLHVALD